MKPTVTEAVLACFSSEDLARALSAKNPCWRGNFVKIFGQINDIVKIVAVAPWTPELDAELRK